MESGKYRSEDEMLFVQKRWAFWGGIVFVGLFVLDSVVNIGMSGLSILKLGMKSIR